MNCNRKIWESRRHRSGSMVRSIANTVEAWSADPPIATNAKSVLGANT
ncbi:MAG: hypothetical protein F6K28_42930 [Microcoleus sp. SIO2G3]|nr:hypothetical protein [Microcoleus sp. SIO2G3]